MKWQLIPSSQVPPSGQMAHDAELFQNFQPGQMPILRFFYFSKPTFTLGRLEARRFPLDKLIHPYEVRPTGGRAVLHGDGDLCYAIVAPKNDPLVGGSLMDSYCKISKLFAKGINSLDRKLAMTTEKHLGLGDPHCFSAPSQAELTWNGKKVAGGAQARQGDLFLQQGVFLLSVAEDWKKTFPAASVENMAGLNDDKALAPIQRDALEKALVTVFEQAGVSFHRAG
jgi:lipoate-protein ligase A